MVEEQDFVWCYKMCVTVIINFEKELLKYFSLLIRYLFWVKHYQIMRIIIV